MEINYQTACFSSLWIKEDFLNKPITNLFSLTFLICLYSCSYHARELKSNPFQRSMVKGKFQPDVKLPDKTNLSNSCHNIWITTLANSWNNAILWDNTIAQSAEHRYQIIFQLCYTKIMITISYNWLKDSGQKHPNWHFACFCICAQK